MKEVLVRMWKVKGVPIVLAGGLLGWASVSYGDVAKTCRDQLAKTYRAAFAKNGVAYLTACFVEEISYQGDQLGCGCSTSSASEAFLACIKQRAKNDMFYAVGFHCGAAHRKGWVRR